MNEYITVSEFAKLAGKSQQTIYKQLNNRLNPYIQLVDNKRMLKTTALKEIYGIEVEQPIQPELNNSFNQKNNPIMELLQTNIDVLQVQLKIKDKQIEELNNRLAEAHQLVSVSQDLHKADKVQQQLLLSEKQEHGVKVEEEPIIILEDIPEESEDVKERVEGRKLKDCLTGIFIRGGMKHNIK